MMKNKFRAAFAACKTKSNIPATPRSFFTGKLAAGIMIIIVMLLSACQPGAASVQGTYRVHSDNPAIRQFTAGEDIYLKITNDQTIIYHTTINGKPKYHIEGTYTLDEKTNTLSIQWKEGKLPPSLTVQKEQQEYLIRLGETVYKKE